MADMAGYLMGKTLPSEADLGLAPSDEELSTTLAPSDDDVPLTGDATTDETAPKTEARAAEAPKEPEKTTEEPKQVDLRALQEARAEIREANQRARLLEERWNQYFAAQQQPKAEEPAIPRASDNPIEALQWTQEQLIEAQRREQEAARAKDEQAREEQAWQQAAGYVGSRLSEAVKADPGIDEAYRYMRDSIGREAMLAGHTYESARALVDQIERQHVMYMAQTGADPAAYIKGLAQTRGWAPKPAAPAAPKSVDVQAVAAAQQRHMSLSDAGGGETPAPMDAKALARMSDKEFAAWMSRKGNAEKFDEIMGR